MPLPRVFGIGTAASFGWFTGAFGTVVGGIAALGDLIHANKSILADNQKAEDECRLWHVALAIQWSGAQRELAVEP